MHPPDMAYVNCLMNTYYFLSNRSLVVNGNICNLNITIEYSIIV